MVQISKREFRAATLAKALPLDLFKALCDPSRLAVLAELAACKPPCTVGRIAECCPTDVSVVSRHLATLRAAGVVEAHRSGKEVHYELSTSSLAKTLRSIADAIETGCPPRRRRKGLLRNQYLGPPMPGRAEEAMTTADKIRESVRRPLEIDRDARHDRVLVADPVQVGVNPVEHDAQVRIEVPVDAQRRIVLGAALDVLVT